MPLVTLPSLLSSRQLVSSSPYVTRTPLVLLNPACPHLGSQPKGAAPLVHLKLESLQLTGSFKIRGVVVQMGALPPDTPGCCTMSAGNYGKAFAYVARKQGVRAVVCLPDAAPPERAALLASMGAEVAKTPTANLMSLVAQYQRDRGFRFVHPFDDLDLIRGYGSCGLEILDDLPDAEVVVVPCGGGGILSGVAAAVKLSGSKARVVGVEPEGAPKMFNSRKAGQAVSMDAPKTIATGLAPPFAGKITFEHVQAFVDDLVLVSDAEIAAAVRMLAKAGLVVEPSGGAAFAAVLAGRLGDLAGRKVVCVVTGSNVALGDLAKL